MAGISLIKLVSIKHLGNARCTARRHVDKALWLPFRGAWSDGKGADMQTNITVAWSNHHKSYYYKFRQADPISLLSWALPLQMERKQSYNYTGIAGEATGIGQGCWRNRNIQGVGSVAEVVFIRWHEVRWNFGDLVGTQFSKSFRTTFYFLPKLVIK